MSDKIKMLVIPSDREGGIGKFRSIDPHVLIANKYRDEFDIDIVFDMPHGDLESFFKQYDLIHIHKQLDENCQVMDMIKFLGIPVIVDIDDYFVIVCVKNKQPLFDNLIKPRFTPAQGYA